MEESLFFFWDTWWRELADLDFCSLAIFTNHLTLSITDWSRAWKNAEGLMLIREP